jgi:hypothetical protein
MTVALDAKRELVCKASAPRLRMSQSVAQRIDHGEKLH